MNHFIDDEGLSRVMYTGHGRNGKYGILARSDDGLLSYTDKKAVLTKYHHDGHVWKEKNLWYTITSKNRRGMGPEGKGDGVMLWSSSDLENWEEQGEIFTQPKYESAASWGDREGFMEFPYLLTFGNKDVLILGGHPVRYWVGHFDRQKLKFIPDKPSGFLLDQTNPFHCYNPLCVDQKGPKGATRRIVMAMYKYLDGGSEQLLPWSGTHVLPRALEFDGQHLRQEPLPEMQALHGAHYSKRDITVKPNTSGYIEKCGDAVEIIAEFEPRDACCFGLKVFISDDDSSFVRIYFEKDTNEYGVDGDVQHAGQGPSYIPKGQPVQMHVFLDRRLVETFVNGQTCTTARIDRSSSSTGIDLFSEGAPTRCRRVEIWEMNPAGPG
jgi:sucrose-6-phosphate hydrolase SacC (GH32 family)